MNKKPFPPKNYSSDRIPLGVKPKKSAINLHFFYYSLTLASAFLFFINLVSPEFLWSKIIFFFIIYCFSFSFLCIFSQKYGLNIIKAFYFLSLVLLLFFNQFNLLNFIITTVLLVIILFLINPNKNNKN